MGYLIHPSTPESSLARSVGQGFNGAQGTRTNAKHPPKSTLTTSFRSRKAIPRPVPLGTHLQGPPSALLGSSAPQWKAKNWRISHRPHIHQLPEAWRRVVYVVLGAVLGGAHFHPFLLILETRDAIRMKVADLESM
jgi:hypothetical protein